MAWFEGALSAEIFGVAPWRGDWFGWAFTLDPETITVYRSANGLEWSAAGDLAREVRRLYRSSALSSQRVLTMDEVIEAHADAVSTAGRPGRCRAPRPFARPPPSDRLAEPRSARRPLAVAGQGAMTLKSVKPLGSWRPRTECSKIEAFSSDTRGSR